MVAYKHIICIETNGSIRPGAVITGPNPGILSLQYDYRTHHSRLASTFDSRFTKDSPPFFVGFLPPVYSSQIKKIQRPTPIPDTGLMCDLIWSDPDKDLDEWGPNDRGVSFTFGETIVGQFLHKHDLDLICRAHQVVEDGYEFFAHRQLVTLFSAPNYCGEFDNAAAMMTVDESLMCSFQILKPAERRQKFKYSSCPPAM